MTREKLAAMMAMATAVLLLLALPAGSTGGAQPEAGGLGAPVAAAEVAAEAAAAAEPVTGGPGELLARLADNIDTIDEIFEPAAEAARSNTTRTEEASFGNAGPVTGPKREPKGGWCLDDRQKKTWCPQACLSCWKRDHAKTWLETGDDEHLGHVRLVHALDRKEQAVARLRREMQGLRNSTVAMEISAAELAAKLAGKQLWVDVMSELEKVAGLALRELDSMAADGHPEHAAALPGGTEQLKDVLQAVQYSVMLAERARVALSGNAIELVELEVLPCDGAWSEWSSCTNATAAERTCCTPCPKYAKKKTKQGGVQSKEKKTGKPRTFDRDTEGEPPSSKALPIMAQQEDSPPTSNDGGSETSATEQPSGESAAAILREVGVLGRNTEHEGGDVYQELLAVGAGHISRRDWGRAIKVYRKAVAVRPEVADAHIALGGALFDSAHYAEAAHSFLEATERTPGGSEKWAAATSAAFEALRQTVGRSHGRSNKPEWWDDEGLKALSARVVNAAPSLEVANRMRAVVLSGLCSGAWEARPRSATELRLAALHFERCAELSPCKPAGPWKTTLASYAQWCISRANAM